MAVLEETIDIAVIGAGHAGCEAALAAARMGLETVVFTVSVDSIAMMPCNPNIGGTSKGHLVKEIDALGGEMGKNIDKTFIQSKMLNLSLIHICSHHRKCTAHSGKHRYRALQPCSGKLHRKRLLRPSERRLPRSAPQSPSGGSSDDRCFREPRASTGCTPACLPAHAANAPPAPLIRCV